MTQVCGYTILRKRELKIVFWIIIAIYSVLYQMLGS